MNSRQRKITSFLDKMGLKIIPESLNEFSATEQGYLQQLADRMNYLDSKIKNDKQMSEAKASLSKHELQALQWVFYQFNIIADQAHKTNSMRQTTNSEKVNN